MTDENTFVYMMDHFHDLMVGQFRMLHDTNDALINVQDQIKALTDRLILLEKNYE